MYETDTNYRGAAIDTLTKVTQKSHKITILQFCIILIRIFLTTVKEQSEEKKLTFITSNQKCFKGEVSTKCLFDVLIARPKQIVKMLVHFVF